MKKILLQLSHPGFAHNAIFGNDVNGMKEPWRELRSRFASLGYEFITADDNSLDDCAWILFLDSSSVDGLKPVGVKNRIKALVKKFIKTDDKRPARPNRPLYEEAIKRNMGHKMAIFLWEGKVNNPDNYTAQVYDRFKYLFTWDDDLADNKKFFKFFLPIPNRALYTNQKPFTEKKLLVNISANRYYPRPNELYSARMKTSAYFSAHHPEDFDLFGARWQAPATRLQKYLPWLIPKFACYRGMTPDKMETMSQYKFALCYENLANTKGYITEKIFDAIKAGAVPIYWGASNILDYVDEEVFIDRRKFKDDEDLAKYLINVTEEEHEKMLSAGRAYILTKRFKKFLPEYFCDRIIEVLNLKTIQ